MAISRKYRSYGVRRLNNLSDIQDKEAALNSLLNNLQEREGESFISQDIDVIRGIKDTEIFPATFIQFAASAPTYTFANTLGPQEDFIRPFIRLQDKFNIYRAVTGEPGTLGSGYGPNAWAVPSSRIKVDPVAGDTVDDLIAGFTTDKTDLVYKEDFWALGEFTVNDRFFPTFSNDRGGVIWEGYYIPNYSTTSPRLYFNSTGLFHTEIDHFDDGQWEVKKSIYKPQRTVKTSANTDDSDTITLIPGDGRFVAIGDKLATNTDITVLSVIDDVVEISSSITIGSNTDIDFVFDPGLDTIRDSFALDPVYDLGQRVKIRFFWWYPTSNTTIDEKYLRIDRDSSSILIFSNLSNNEVVDSDSSGLLRTVNDGVSGYQSEYGDQGNYKVFKTSGVVRSSYTPPASPNAINKLDITNMAIEFAPGKSYITGNATRLAGTEVGNVVVPIVPSFDLLPKNTRIKRQASDNPINSVRVITESFSLSASANTANVYIIDHNGLMDYFITTTANTTIRVDSTEAIRSGMVCIAVSTPSPTRTTITGVANSSTFFVSSPINIANNYIFVYADSGLIDRSKEVFCQGVIGRQTATLTSSGASSVSVTSNTDIVTGMRVQYSGALEPSSNITVTQVAGTTVTLSGSTTGIIEAGSTLVFAPAISTGDKQQCVIPLDLSPPFRGEPYGLDTKGKRIVGVPGANLDITVLTLSSNTAIVNTANSSDVFDAKIMINGGFRIKARRIN